MTSHRVTTARKRTAGDCDLKVQECLVDNKDGQVVPSSFSRRSAPVRSHCSFNDGKETLVAGCKLNSRYVIYRRIGEGSTASVWECLDRKEKEHVVIKIVNIEAYNYIGYAELQFYNLFAKIVESRTRFSQVRDNFEHCNRLCIVFEKLGPSVYDVLLLNKREPLPLKFVRDLGRQLLESVELFHRFRVIHTDLKPDNILFVSQEYVKQPGSESAKGLLPGRIPFIYLLPKSSAIKVIDFGHAVREEDACDRIVSARCYRAPEVILGLGWSFPCDIWSVGCILVELFLGIPIFSTEDDMEHLARMEAYLGQFPRQMLDRIKPTNDKKYVKNGVLNWPEGAKSSNCVERVSRLPELQSENFLRFYCDSDEFVSFVLDLLTLDPSNRPTAREALEHPFFLTRD